jgi:co-chaperonin GroES (HSP10)
MIRIEKELDRLSDEVGMKVWVLRPPDLFKDGAGEEIQIRKFEDGYEVAQVFIDDTDGYEEGLIPPKVHGFEILEKLAEFSPDITRRLATPQGGMMDKPQKTFRAYGEYILAEQEEITKTDSGIELPTSKKLKEAIIKDIGSDVANEDEMLSVGRRVLFGHYSPIILNKKDFIILTKKDILGVFMD